MSAIDRDRLGSAFASEQELFVTEHPHSAERSVEARRHLLGGVPMAWMTRRPGSFPIFVAEAEGARIVDVDGTRMSTSLSATPGQCAGTLSRSLPKPSRSRRREG